MLVPPHSFMWRIPCTGRIRPYRTLVVALALAATGCSSPEQAKRSHFDKANAAAAAGRDREAVIEYRNAIQADPTYAEAHLKLAETYVRLHEITSAVPEYIRAADLRPKDTELQLVAGGYLLALRRPDEAGSRARAVLARDPRNVQAHVLLGNALAGLADLDKAVAEIEEAIHLDPTRPGTFTNLGAIELARGRREEAESAFKKAVQLGPRSPQAALALGNYYFVTGRYEEAEHTYSDALQLDPANALANRAMAAFMLSRGRIHDAEPYLKRVADGTKTPASVLSLADYYVASGRSTEAIARLEPLSRDSRTAATAGPRLAQAYAAAGDLAKANAVLEQLLRNDSSNTEAHLIKAQLLVRAGKADEALQEAQSAAELDPRSASTQFALGRLYAGRGDLAGAEKAFTETLRLNPRATAAQIELSKLQLVSGRASDAVQTASNALQARPGSLDARLALVRGLLAAKEWPRAESELASLAAQFPNVPAVQVQRGLLLAGQQKPVEARAAFETALRLDTDWTEALVGLLALDVMARDLPAARKRIDARLAAERQPSAPLLLVAARTYGALGQLAVAEQYLRRAIEADTAYLPAYAALGQLYLGQKKLDQARAEFETLAQRHSQPAAALTMAGMILQVQGRLPDARERFEQALAIDPDAAVAANNLAWMLAESGENLDRALQLAQRASATLPEAAEVDDTIGWIYVTKKLPQLALPPLQRAVARDPGRAAYLYHLGRAYVDTGDIAHGRESLERALRLGHNFPGAGDARQLLDRLLSTVTK